MINTVKAIVIGFILFWLVISLLSCSSRKPVPGKGNYINEHKHQSWWWHQADTLRQIYQYEFEEYLHCKNESG